MCISYKYFCNYYRGYKLCIIKFQLVLLFKLTWCFSNVSRKFCPDTEVVPFFIAVVDLKELKILGS